MLARGSGGSSISDNAQFCELQPIGLERRQRSVRRRSDGDARPGRRRAVLQCPSPVKHLLGREGAEDAALGEGRVESRV
jgi:hypothetical protein